MKGDRRDAAHVWHLLDQTLPALREMRDDLEEAGLGDEAAIVAEVIESAEAKHAKAGREVAGLLDGDGGDKW